jgi:hypothetical protein
MWEQMYSSHIKLHNETGETKLLIPFKKENEKYDM